MSVKVKVIARIIFICKNKLPTYACSSPIAIVWTATTDASMLMMIVIIPIVMIVLIPIMVMVVMIMMMFVPVLLPQSNDC